MTQLLAALDAGWRVLLVGLVLGAGLPTMFAFGVRALAWGTGGDAEVHDTGITVKPHLAGRLVAYTMFAIVILSVLLGVGYILAHGLGMTITFNGIVPVFTPKG
jgi:hypothetical protein